MPKYKIIFDRETCIGSLACVLAEPGYWIKDEEGKVKLRGATFNEDDQQWELIIRDDDLKKNQEAADMCPVAAIRIEVLDD